ncbi:MAG: pleiotropic regulatory protein [Microgenomates group bacterium GW2011_GWC1_39_12]|nr:MAG: pleiotropic regulatory protein [Microgenomates group bacterium GW2011_GWC1_39_12]
MNIPIFNLTKQYKTIQKEINSAIQTVFSRGNFILGVEVAAFEKEFAEYIGVPYAVGVASGTDALTLAVRALGLSKEDEVLLPVNSYPTFFGIAMSGVSVRFVDCNKSGNISIEDLKIRITNKTKAIVVVHLYGNPADVVGVQELLKTLHRTDIKVIEDCAQAHGATIGKQKVGIFGDIAIFSFYPSKNLGAYGDGGMVVTKHKKIADHIRAIRMYGEVKRYESREVSGVSRLDELQAAVLRVKLRHLDDWNARRRQITEVYTKGLDNIQNISVIPYESGACYHLFVIRTNRRDELKAYLKKEGIGCAIHYPKPLVSKFPMAEKLSKEILSLPIYPELTNTNIVHIANTIKQFFLVKFL